MGLQRNLRGYTPFIVFLAGVWYISDKIAGMGI